MARHLASGDRWINERGLEGKDRGEQHVGKEFFVAQRGAA
jgi:hypothetical protein